MILRWMVYAGTVALCFGLAALVLERVVRQRGWPVRWPTSVRVVGAGRPGEPHPELAAATVALVRQRDFAPGVRHGQRVGAPLVMGFDWVPSRARI
jgi:hypothetical protein